MVTLGIDTLLDDPEAVLGDDRVGLITNPSGVDRELTPTIDRLHAHSEVDLRVLYGPEHGIRGSEQAGVKVADFIDGPTGLPVRSMYGESRRLTPEMVEDVDTVVYDMQDIGSRYYTLIYTLAYALEGAAEAGVGLVVLDRPNPIAPLPVAGNRVEEEFSSFVGNYRLPIVHGLTVGELADYFNEAFDIGADLRVVELEGWDHDTWYDETDVPWVPPSPNMPTLSTATLYPGTCFFEGTTLSEGRGTTRPFEMLGAPWIDAEEWVDLLEAQELDGVGFRPEYFTPTFSKHEDEACEGVQLHLLDREAVDPVRVGLTLLVTAFTRYEESDWREHDGYPIDRLSGSDQLRRVVDERREDDSPGEIVDDVLSEWEADREGFEDVRNRYRRY